MGGKKRKSADVDIYAGVCKVRRDNKKEDDGIQHMKNMGFELVEKCDFEFESPTDRVISSISIGRRPILFDLVRTIFNPVAVESVLAGTGKSYETFLDYIAYRMLHSVSEKIRDNHDPKRRAFTEVKNKYINLIPIEKLWGVGKYEEMSDLFLVRRDTMRGVFSYELGKLITHGEFVALDEKQYKFTGESPTIRKNRNKPDPIGHMMTMLTCKLSECGLPFCFGFYPYDKDIFIPDSSNTSDMVANWACDVVERGHFLQRMPLIVADSLYNAYESRTVYMGRGFQFIMALGTAKMGGLVPYFAHDVRTPGQTKYAWNEVDRQVLCCHYARDPKKNGKKYVVSNAFKLRRGHDFDARAPPVYSQYNVTFSLCDEFNHKMAGQWFPFRVHNYERHWNLMFYSMMFMNIHVLGRHIKLIDEEQSFEKSMLQISLALLNRGPIRDE